jgi:cobalamin biosynthesis Mg chelatase CobN
MTDKNADQSASDHAQNEDQSSRESYSPRVSNLTPDSPSVQGQEQESSSAGTQEQKIAGSASSGSGSSGQKDAKKTRMAHELLAYEKNLSSLLSWKEELKLLTLGANINLSYYELWRHDANLIFRRCVLVRNRQERYRKYKDRNEKGAKG